MTIYAYVFAGLAGVGLVVSYIDPPKTARVKVETGLAVVIFAILAVAFAVLAVAA